MYNCLSLDLYCCIYLGCSKTVILPNKLASRFNFKMKSAFFLPKTKTSEVSRFRDICFLKESIINSFTSLKSSLSS